MLYAELMAWFAKQTLAFWLRIVGMAIIAAILITPTCMYKNTKAELDTAKATIKAYEDASEQQRTRGKKAAKVIIYKDRIIEKKVIETKIRLEKVYAEDPVAKEWANGFIPDSVIDSLQDNTAIYPEGSN